MTHPQAAHSPADAPAAPAAEWIDTRPALEDFLRRVEDATFVGMDLEADNLHHYKEQLCLIQLAADGRVALIDPLAIEDCSSLLEFIDDERRDLWMHGADFDMRLMLAAFDWLPHRIRDTQIAAQLVGRRQFGLAALVQHYLGITLSKSSQKQDWSRRPLTPTMLEYAAQDAAVIFPLKEHLCREMEECGRREWFEDACRSARRQVLARTPRDMDDAWRITGSGGLRGRELAYLRALWHWRDSEARRRDVPTFKVISNQELLDLSKHLDEGKRPEVRRRISAPARDALHALAREVAEMPESQWPTKPKTLRRKRPGDFEDRVEVLKQKRDREAEALGIDPSVVASRKTLEALVLGGPDADDVRLLPWQRRLLGLDGDGMEDADASTPPREEVGS